MTKRFFILPLMLGLTVHLYAQLPTPCGAGTPPATSCFDACIFCNFDGYEGSTTGYGQTEAVDYCGTLENGQWIGFIAGETHATFTVNPQNCLNGDGVQIAIYKDCGSAPLDCNKGKIGNGTTGVSVTADLEPGSNYFLLVDGYAGDFCEFTIDVSPKSAVYEPPLGMVGAIEGPSELCPGATFKFSTEPVSGAGAYIWSGPPGTLVNGQPAPFAAVGSQGNVVEITVGNQSGQICVQAANSCSQNPPCASSHQVNIIPNPEYPHIEADTVQYLNCFDQPLDLHIAVTPPAFYLYEWSSDSLGHFHAGQNSQRARVDSIGTYTVQVVNGVNGCASTLDIRVDQPNYPQGGDFDLTNIRCYGFNDGIIEVGEVIGGTEPFVFSLDELPYTVTTEFRYLEPGDHTLRIQGADGCEWDTTLLLTEPEEFILTLDPDVTIALGETLNLSDSYAVNFPERVQQLLISPATMQAMLCDTCTYVPPHSFHYTLTAVDSNNCRSSDDRTVVVSKERHVFIPNAIKVNSGGANETFRVFGGIDVDRVRLLQVYNRWGKAVFSQQNILPDDPATGWDGRIDGDPAEPGVFFYVAEIEFKDGETVQYKGDVTVVR